MKDPGNEDLDAMATAGLEAADTWARQDEIDGLVAELRASKAEAKELKKQLNFRLNDKRDYQASLEKQDAQRERAEAEVGELRKLLKFTSPATFARFMRGAPTIMIPPLTVEERVMRLEKHMLWACRQGKTFTREEFEASEE